MRTIIPTFLLNAAKNLSFASVKDIVFTLDKLLIFKELDGITGRF